MTSPASPSPLQYAAIAVSSAVVLLPVSLAKIVEFFLKSSNPDDVDVSQGLAYLRPILLTAWIGLVAVAALAVVLNILTHRRHGSAGLGWLVLGIQVALGLTLLLAQMGVDNVAP